MSRMAPEPVTDDGRADVRPDPPAEVLLQPRAELAKLRRELVDTTRALEAARDELADLRAQRPGLRGSLEARLRRMMRRFLPASRGAGRPHAWEEEPQEVDAALPFGGFAAASSFRHPEELLEARPEVVALCHPEWRGIRAATYELCPHVLEIPGYVSHEQAEKLSRFLADAGTRSLVVHGFPPGSERLLAHLHRELPRLAQSIVFHGSPAAFHAREDRIVEKMLALADEGVVRKLGFVKKGFAEFFRQQGYAAEHVANVCRLPHQPPRPAPLSNEHLHLGVFGTQVCHKNVEAQLLAALMVPRARVHVLETPPTRYLDALQYRIDVHGLQPRERFLSLLQEMHAASYVSLVECYPMTVLESIASGVVCLTSHTSALFDDDDLLFRELVVTRHDDVAAISRQLIRVLERRHELVARAQAHLLVLNASAEARWREFLAT